MLDDFSGEALPYSPYVAPVTVLESIKRSTEFLTRKGVESPRLQAELLLADLLKMPRLKLYLDFERSLTEPEVEKLRELVKRRGQREPLQHILGTVSFCGIEIGVNRDALIPRPETELLAERAWQSMARLVEQGTAAPKVLDFGTGTGCLATVLAMKQITAEVWALDISEKALALARQNAERNGVGGRIHFVLGNGFEALKGLQPFDLIVSNPPYIPTQDIKGLQPEVRDYDPLPALDGGPDGLVVIRHLAERAQAFLTPGGRLFMEFGDGQAEEVRSIFGSAGWQVEEIVNDYSGRARILIAQRALS